MTQNLYYSVQVDPVTGCFHKTISRRCVCTCARAGSLPRVRYRCAGVTVRGSVS